MIYSARDWLRRVYWQELESVAPTTISCFARWQHPYPGYFGFTFVQWEEVEARCPSLCTVYENNTVIIVINYLRKNNNRTTCSTNMIICLLCNVTSKITSNITSLKSMLTSGFTQDTNSGLLGQSLGFIWPILPLLYSLHNVTFNMSKTSTYLWFAEMYNANIFSWRLGWICCTLRRDVANLNYFVSWVVSCK